MKSKNKYFVLIEQRYIAQIRKDSPAHVGKLKHSIDYTCNEGTRLLATQDGEVVWVKQDSKIGGPDKKYWNDGNRIVIKHKNEEYSAYEHLRPNGASVKVGDKVKKGQLIGYSGNTGYTFGPHLHFEVFRFTGLDKENDFETLEVNFEQNISNKKFNFGNLEKKLCLFFGIIFLLASFIMVPFSLTGFTVLNSSIKITLLPLMLFLIAIVGIYLSIK